MIDVTDIILHVTLSSADPDIADNDVVVGNRGIAALDGHGFSLATCRQRFEFHQPVALSVCLDGQIADGKPYSDIFSRMRFAPDTDGFVPLNHHVVTEEVGHREFVRRQARQRQGNEG